MIVIIWTVVSIISAVLLWMYRPFITTNYTSSAAISIIIPARNEAHNLPHLLSSFNLSDVFECIVVDDGSTDRTAEIARAYGARVIEFNNDTQWKGKSAACYKGAGAATGDILMFIDADTFFHDKGAVKRIAAAYNNGLMSVQPYHMTSRLYEQGSIYFNLLTVLGMNVTSIFKSDDGVFGPCVVCSRQDYIATGGHKAASDGIIEGFSLGRVFKEHGFALHNYLGKKTIHFRMYPDGLKSMTTGWMKHFAAGSANTDKRTMLLIICWLSWGFMPLLLLIDPAQFFMIMMSYIVYAAVIYVMARTVGTFKWWTALCYPLLLLYFLYVFMQSVIATYLKKEVTWKGRRVKLGKDDVDGNMHD